MESETPDSEPRPTPPQHILEIERQMNRKIKEVEDRLGQFILSVNTQLGQLSDMVSEILFESKRKDNNEPR